MALKRTCRCIATVLLGLLALSFCGCTHSGNGDSDAGKKTVVCMNDAHSAYPDAMSHMLPEYTVEYANSNPFRHLRDGKVIEAFDAQAASALETGVAQHWYPQYLATMVIAIDREQTDAQIGTWSDLPGAGETVGVFGVALFSYETLLSSIAYGLDGEGYSLKSAAGLLATLNAQGRLVQNSYEPPILLCFDTTVAGLIKSGRNLEIIVPAEGTLTFTKGLLSNNELVFAEDAEALLVSSGLRLVDGRCDAALYSGAAAYENAHRISDYAYFNAASLDATRSMRRDVFHTRMYSSADGREHLYWVLLYIIPVAVWILSIIHRTVQKAVRRAVLYTGIILIGWITARLISYQLENVGLFNLTFWYSYYIFQLALPVVILWLGWVIDKPEGRTPLLGWMRAVHLAGAVLLALVLTNNLHHLVFVPDLSHPRWGITYAYTHGFVFYLVQAACWLPLIAGVILLLHKGRGGLRKRGVAFLFALFGLLAAYTTGYILQVPIAQDSDITMTTGIFIMLLLETCIRSGIIPVNSKYRALFAHSPLAMRIIDTEDRLVFASETAVRAGQAAPVPGVATATGPQDENTLLFDAEITGGRVFWSKDISALNRLHREIAESVAKLKAANVLLGQEEAVKRAIHDETEKARLMQQLEDEIVGHIHRLNAMMEQAENSMASPKFMVRITMLLAYIKRRCNLFFWEQETAAFQADELTLYLDELSEMAGHAGVSVLFTCGVRGSLPIRRATIFYDFFYAALDWAAQRAELRLLAHLGRENGAVILRMLSSEDARRFGLDEGIQAEILSQGGQFSVKELDDDATGISLSFPEGGEDDG